MKKFTLKVHDALCMILMLWMVAPSVSAAPSKVTDLFGKYKFTSKMELTELGQQYADELKAECEVEFAADENGIYDMAIKGLAGGGTQYVNAINFEEAKIRIPNPNGNSGLWSKLSMADAEGQYPWGTYSDLVWYYDASEPLTFTIPDFTAVVCNYAMSSAEVAARFTECKLTMVEGVEIEIADISADYHFKPLYTMAESTLPTEFDMNVASVDGNKELYNVSFTFPEGFGTVKFENCTFDGVSLTLPFENAYVNDTVFLRQVWSTTPMKGQIVFKTIANSTSLSLDSYIYLGKSKVEGTPTTEEEIENLQYYGNGTAVNVTGGPAVDYAGRYTIKGTRYDILSGKDETVEFTMEITFSEYNSTYYLTEFLSSDKVNSSNYGGIPCTVDGGKLKIAVSSAEKDYKVNSEMGDNGPVAYDILLNGLGERGGDVEFVVNEDGSVTLGDFFVAHQKLGADWKPESEENTYYYNAMTGTKEGSGVGTAVAEKAQAVYAQNGAIYVKGGAAVKLQVFNAGGYCVFNGTASQVSGLAKGLYIVKCGDSVAKVIL